MQQLTDRYVAPHKIISREVTEADIPRVVEEAKVMKDLCFKPIGKHRGAFAIAHPQIDDKDPLTFFVDNEGRVIINPKICHEESLEPKVEACMTFPDKDPVGVQRFHKIAVTYQVLEDGKLSEEKYANYANLRAEIFQHEVDHFQGKYLYSF